jgi:hypothetical protein
VPIIISRLTAVDSWVGETVELFKAFIERPEDAYSQLRSGELPPDTQNKVVLCIRDSLSFQPLYCL